MTVTTISHTTVVNCHVELFNLLNPISPDTMPLRALDPGFVVHFCQHQICAGHFWWHLGYGLPTCLGLCALKFWPVYWPLRVQRVQTISVQKPSFFVFCCNVTYCTAGGW